MNNNFNNDNRPAINDPFANLSKEQNQVDAEKRKTKLIVIGFSVIIVLLVCYILVLKVKSSLDKPAPTPEPKENLEEVAVDLQDYITENNLDALDAFGKEELLRLAINHVCYGVEDCDKVSGSEVTGYIKNVFNRDVSNNNVLCEFGDGVLYFYEAETDKYLRDSEHQGHTGYSTIPIYTKLNSIKKTNGKYVIVLNKLYYNEGKSENITSDALGVYKVFSFYDYDMPSADGAVIDMTKLTSDFEENFDKLKNRGVRYQYTFIRDGKKYYLEKYEVLNNN